MRDTLLRSIAIGLLLATASTGSSEAHARHHRRHVAVGAPRVVFSDPERVRAASEAGIFAGTFVTGIMGAATANPYDRPGY